MIKNHSHIHTSMTRFRPRIFRKWHFKRVYHPQKHIPQGYRTSLTTSEDLLSLKPLSLPFRCQFHLKLQTYQGTLNLFLIQHSVTICWFGISLSHVVTKIVYLVFRWHFSGNASEVNSLASQKTSSIICDQRISLNIFICVLNR